MAVFQRTMEVPRERAAVSSRELYQEHRHKVFRWALRYGGGDVGWAEDLTHDVFVKAIEHLDELSEPHDLGGWLYRVTANLAMRRLRREGSLLRRVLRLYGAGREESSGSPHRLFEGRELAAKTMEALGALPARERIAAGMTP